MAATLGVAATTIWGIRVGFGIADKQLGDSKTTQWRKTKTTITRYSRPPGEADENEEEEA